VTGAGSAGEPLGTGAASAVVLASRGSHVFVADRDGDRANNTVSRIKGDGGRASAVVADVSLESDCLRLAQTAAKASSRVDILVNNAALSPFSLVENTSVTTWNEVMATNATAAMLMVKHCTPWFREGSAIINIAALAAFRPVLGKAAYIASKGALDALTRAFAIELGPRGVRANCVCPGQIWAPMVARKYATAPEATAAREERRHASVMNTEGTAWDVAALVAFLASADARWITGQTIFVDGGESLQSSKS